VAGVSEKLKEKIRLGTSSDALSLVVRCRSQLVMHCVALVRAIDCKGFCFACYDIGLVFRRRLDFGFARPSSPRNS
jgi:hypothetical protein